MAKEILTGTHPGIEAVPLRVGPSIGPEFNLVRAFLIPKACFKLEDAHFAFDSSFVTPDGFDIAPLKELLDTHPGTKLSIFGHADPTGDDAYNKTLSGRRAKAVFGLLTRDVAIWQKLHDLPAGGDNWKPEAEPIMRAATSLPVGTARSTLIKAYMDHLCTVRDANGQPGAKVELTKDDFLARGKGADGKGDIQGCSEFNPLMLFSTSEKATLDKPANHPQRNRENQVNRRVMVLLFRPGSLVDPNKWPCPTVEEGIGKCLKRFHSDGQTRRSNQAQRREFKNTKDTFACRFYDRLSNNSPCERGRLLEDCFVFLKLFADDFTTVLAQREYLLRGLTSGVRVNGVTDGEGVLRHEFLPDDHYELVCDGLVETVENFYMAEQERHEGEPWFMRVRGLTVS